MVATEYIAVSGATTGMLKLSIYFEELACFGPVIAEVGTNLSWSSGVEVKMIKESIKKRLLGASQTHPAVAKHPLWDEYVVHPSTYRTINLIASKSSLLDPHAESIVSGVSCEPIWTFTVKIQDTGAWGFIKVPNPVLAGRGDCVSCAVLKTWLVTQLALPNGFQLINDVRIFRNDSGLAKGDPLADDDDVWKNLWYFAIVDPKLEPLWEYPDHSSPVSLARGWNDVQPTTEATTLEDDVLDGPQ
ncbi:unnamed protein product [Prorocentrum cordatum]|uniref:Uncharacterized protein n=1 Tax=Prorocentrum cordatum TaxID=2364126 RepID=A0ABN9TTX1_9DINO|nr:unnamed protein product [Polarella glacialis]